VSRYPNRLYGQLAAELNLVLKPQANDIKIIPIFIYGVISPPTNKIRIFNWFWGGLLMVHSKLCFCGRIEPTFKFHLISFLFFSFLFFSFYATDMIEDNNKMKYNFFFCLDATDTNTFGLFVQIQSIQSSHLGSTLTCCGVGIFGRCSWSWQKILGLQNLVRKFISVCVSDD